MTQERLVAAERPKEIELPLVRMLPLQMEDPDVIRERIKQESRNPDFVLRRIPLTSTVLLLTKPHNGTFGRVSLIGGEVPLSDRNPTERMDLDQAALVKLSQEAHAYGVPASSLHIVRARKPFTYISAGTSYHCQETIFAAEVPPTFSPRVIGLQPGRHEFIRINRRETQNLFKVGYHQTEEGDTYPLIGNLRLGQKYRLHDHHLEADGKDVRETHSAILFRMARFEAEVQRKVAIRLLKTGPYKSGDNTVFNPPAGWREKWHKELTHNPLSDQLSLTAFTTAYAHFLTDYAGQITGVVNPNLWLARDFARAYDFVFRSRKHAFNATIPTQGDYLNVKDRDIPAFIRFEESQDERKGEPQIFTRLQQCAFEAFGAKTGKELIGKMLDYRKLALAQRSMQSDQTLTSEEVNIIVNYDAMRTQLYKTYAKYFMPDYERFQPGEDILLRHCEQAYAENSNKFDEFYSTVVTESGQEMSSHPSFPLALEQLARIMTDQLDEHLLGSFRINMTQHGPILLDKQVGYEYGRKLIGTTLFLTDTEPHYREEVAESTSYLRNIISSMQVPDIAEQRYFLVADRTTHQPTLLPVDISWIKAVQRYDFLGTYTTIHVDLNGHTYKILFKFDTKEEIHIQRKAIERGRIAKGILDVTRFTFAVDDSDPTLYFENERERNVYYNNVIYAFEARMAEKAKELGYIYKVEQEDEDHRRKDLLDGNTAPGGSAASRPVRLVKFYQTISVKNPLRQRFQTQEIQLMDLRAFVDDLNDWPRYSRERLRTPKYASIQVNGQNTHVMLYPLLYVLAPPDIPAYTRSYQDLMLRKRPKVRRAALLKILQRFTNFYENWVTGISLSRSETPEEM